MAPKRKRKCEVGVDDIVGGDGDHMLVFQNRCRGPRPRNRRQARDLKFGTSRCAKALSDLKFMSQGLDVADLSYGHTIQRLDAAGLPYGCTIRHLLVRGLMSSKERCIYCRNPLRLRPESDYYWSDADYAHSDCRLRFLQTYAYVGDAVFDDCAESKDAEEQPIIMEEVD
jgi:hypothetical protein